MSRKKSHKKAHNAQKQKTIKDGISFVPFVPFCGPFCG
jgi:hypothetical protein